MSYRSDPLDQVLTAAHRRGLVVLWTPEDGYRMARMPLGPGPIRVLAEASVARRELTVDVSPPRQPAQAMTPRAPTLIQQRPVPPAPPRVERPVDPYPVSVPVQPREPVAMSEEQAHRTSEAQRRRAIAMRRSG